MQSSDYKVTVTKKNEVTQAELDKLEYMWENERESMTED